MPTPKVEEVEDFLYFLHFFYKKGIEKVEDYRYNKVEEIKWIKWRIFIERNIETMKARIFNIMQYVNHPETGVPLLSRETIEETMKRKGIKQYAYVLHDKDAYSEADEEADPNHRQEEVKPPHWHIVIQCGYTMEIGVIAKWLGIAENFVDIPKGAGAGKFLDCVEYLTHERAEQQALGKHRYDDSEIIANFDFRAKLDKRNLNKAIYGKDLDEKDQMRYDVLYGGKTLRQCMKQDPLLYMEDFEKLQKLRLQYISMQRPPKTRLNYYICGKGGVGKGLMSRAIARTFYPQYEDDEDIFFEVGAKGAAFEGYDGQPVIIWNDRRAFDLLQELNGRGNVFNVFDTHPTKQKQNIKFSSINLCNTVNIVNSVQDYIEFLEGLAGGYTDKNGEEHEAEDRGQSYRRFPFIIPLHTEDFDLLLNRGFVEETGNYEEYIAHKNLVGNMQRIHSICGANEQLARELEARTVKTITDKHNEVKEKFDHDTQDEDAIREMFKDYGKPRQ